MRLMPPLAALCLVLTGPALAAGSDDDTPPTPTETTELCEDGMIWNPEIEECAAPVEESRLSDDLLYDAAREFAYEGQFEHAQDALRAMSDPSDDRVLTYMGFTTRSLGDLPGGMAYYTAALQTNPNNLLARSYMGQAYVLQGNIEGAMEQLIEITARGGKDSWPERALAEAIHSGTLTFY